MQDFHYQEQRGSSAKHSTPMAVKLSLFASALSLTMLYILAAAIYRLAGSLLVFSVHDTPSFLFFITIVCIGLALSGTAFIITLRAIEKPPLSHRKKIMATTGVILGGIGLIIWSLVVYPLLLSIILTIIF